MPDIIPSPKPGEIVKPDDAAVAPTPTIAPPPAPAPIAQSSPKLSQDWQAWFKQHWMIVAGITILVLATGGAIGYKLTHKAKPAPVAAKPTTPAPEPAKPAPILSPLTGLEVSAADAAKPVVAVVIENQTDARPQSGLSSAGVVYEALAEGGITRFLAFFLETKPPQYGPVRSIRTYFVSWGLEYNAPVAHAGGNADALDLINPLHLKDLNQFSYGNYFYRANDRYAPHNLYTDAAKLDSLLNLLGYNQAATFAPSLRKADSPEATPSHPTIGINYSYNGYQVEYHYEAASNSYLRFLAGAPHIDRNNNQQIKVKNIVVEYMPTAYGLTRIGEQTVRMGASGMPIGSGRAVVFRDGGAVEGTWNKPSNTDRTKLVDAAGKEIPLNAGNTWYSIVPDDRTASY